MVSFSDADVIRNQQLVLQVWILYSMQICYFSYVCLCPQKEPIFFYSFPNSCDFTSVPCWRSRRRSRASRAKATFSCNFLKTNFWRIDSLKIYRSHQRHTFIHIHLPTCGKIISKWKDIISSIDIRVIPIRIQFKPFSGVFFLDNLTLLILLA